MRRICLSWFLYYYLFKKKCLMSRWEEFFWEFWEELLFIKKMLRKPSQNLMSWWEDFFVLVLILKLITIKSTKTSCFIICWKKVNILVRIIFVFLCFISGENLNFKLNHHPILHWYIFNIYFFFWVSSCIRKKLKRK